MSQLLRHPALPEPLQVRRSARARRMSLKVDPAQRVATLVLPPRASAAAALAFVDDHVAWLQDRLAALPASISFLPGQVVPLLDQPHRLVAMPAARRGVWAEAGQIQVSGPAEFFGRRVGDFLKREARRHILARAGRMARQLGRDIAAVRLNDAKTRWGSCSSKGKLAFSWRLVLAPESVLTYVVAHEVAHLRELNHSPAFWTCVAQLTDQHREARRWLRVHGAELYRYG